jgi:meso-butanediol dehydrogenase / (S,S)-butanediol dehydrogenase / diacetyl reductase
MNLNGKIALVTGGGSGIGAAITRRFVNDGAKVCIVGRRQEVLDQLAESLPEGKVAKCPGDVTKQEDVKRMIATALTLEGKLNVLANVAGISGAGSVTEADPDQWRNILDINLFGPFLLMKAAIPHMIEGGGGSVINVSSIGGLSAMQSRSAYCTSKAALIMLTQQAAVDYGAQNIRCNAICPGTVKTAMIEKALANLVASLGSDVDSVIKKCMEDVPLRRAAEPDEVTGICSFLASDDSSYMTGTVQVVDGGMELVNAWSAAAARLVMSSRDL